MDDLCARWVTIVDDLFQTDRSTHCGVYVLHLYD